MELYNMGKTIPNHLYKNISLIKKLEDYADKDKVEFLLSEYNKKQEKEYFLTQKNIKLGKIYTDTKKTSNPLTFLSSPKKSPHQSQRRQNFLSENSIGSYSNAMNLYKRSGSLSSRKLNRLITNIETSNALKKNVIDNIELKRHFNDIRHRINDIRYQKRYRKKIFIEIPINIRNSLYKQEKIFKKIKKEKNNLKINEKNIKQRTKIVDSNDLLINKSSNYNLKNLEISILDKNLNNENKYNNNLWNISLRNKKQNGKYENLGYLNVGNKYEPRYTFFNMNRNIEYFSLPEKSKTENIKNNLNKKNISINIDDNLYKLKTRQNLHFLKNLKYLEINGENLLDFEESREKKIKGNKIMHKNEYLEYLYNKKLNKAKTFEPLYEDKIFAKNYNKLDFMKNSNLNSKFNYI
jgi:hypothetical protein